MFREICGSLRLRGRSLLLKRKLPRNTQISQKFIAEKRLPQISRIYTDASKLFCEFREFCGSKYLCKSVKSVGEYSLPVCSVNSVKSVGASLRLRGRSLLLKRKLPQNSQNSQKFIAEKKLPQISRIYTDASKLFCEFREFCGSKYLCKSVKSVGEYSLPVCSVNSVKSVGASLRLRGRSLLLRRNSHRIHRIHRSLLLRRNSHGIHGIHRSLLLKRNSHRFHGFTQM